MASCDLIFRRRRLSVVGRRLREEAGRFRPKHAPEFDPPEYRLVSPPCLTDRGPISDPCPASGRASTNPPASMGPGFWRPLRGGRRVRVPHGTSRARRDHRVFHVERVPRSVTAADASPRFPASRFTGRGCQRQSVAPGGVRGLTGPPDQRCPAWLDLIPRGQDHAAGASGYLPNLEVRDDPQQAMTLRSPSRQPRGTPTTPVICGLPRSFEKVKGAGVSRSRPSGVRHRAAFTSLQAGVLPPISAQTQDPASGRAARTDRPAPVRDPLVSSAASVPIPSAAIGVRRVAAARRPLASWSPADHTSIPLAGY
jgi:hypothetical protein